MIQAQKAPGIRSSSNRHKLTPEEILLTRDTLMQAAKDRIDPDHLGLRAVMETDDTDFFGTDDVEFRDWLDWVSQLIQVISNGLTRVAVAVASGTLALAASHLYQSERGAEYATPVLGVAGLFAAILLVSSIGSAIRKK